MEQDSIKTYIKQDWVQEKLQTYELLRRLRDDQNLKEKWAGQRIKSLLLDRLDLKKSKAEELVQTFLDQLDFLPIKNANGKPSVHISPKKVGGLSYSTILGIDVSNLSSCLNRLVESAAQDIIQGYGKGAILKSIFGDEFGKIFNEYVIRRMEEEFGKCNEQRRNQNRE